MGSPKRWPDGRPVLCYAHAFYDWPPDRPYSAKECAHYGIPADAVVFTTGDLRAIADEVEAKHEKERRKYGTLLSPVPRVRRAQIRRWKRGEPVDLCAETKVPRG